MQIIPPIYLSSKTVPHRYYDEGGVYHREITAQTPPQEGRAFEYEKRGRNRDLLWPNNVGKYIGINEIFGSMGKEKEFAFPAQEVTLEKGKSYNIFVDTGRFVTCRQCGNDYYSSKNKKLFPPNSHHKGGGYYPRLCHHRSLFSENPLPSR